MTISNPCKCEVCKREYYSDYESNFFERFFQLDFYSDWIKGDLYPQELLEFYKHSYCWDCGYQKAKKLKATVVERKELREELKELYLLKGELERLEKEKYEQFT